MALPRGSLTRSDYGDAVGVQRRLAVSAIKSGFFGVASCIERLDVACIAVLGRHEIAHAVEKDQHFREVAVAVKWMFEKA